MEYTVEKLARLSGVSARTLRYYDSIGLLRPERKGNNYRVYGSREAAQLQQILFYRELGVELDEIGRMVNAPDADRLKALSDHLVGLSLERARMDTLINNVKTAIAELKGECKMNDSERFEGFRKKLVEENEQEYGEECREKYGRDYEDSIARIMGMSEGEWNDSDELRRQAEDKLKAAVEGGDPASKISREACELHGRWLASVWKKGTYSKGAHLVMGEMYAADQRFIDYYDRVAAGAAEFLRDALRIYCAE